MLSIQAGLNGLSFFVLEHFSGNVIDIIFENFKKALTPEKLLNKMIKILDTHESLQERFSKVQVIHSNEMQTVIPSALFDEANLSDYLKYNTKIFKTDFITYDVIQNIDIVLAYVPFMNINNYVFDRFGSFEYKHSATVLIEKILQLEKNNTEPKVFINIECSCFEIIITKNNNLLLYNRFEYSTKEDFIYYILFTAEQLELNPEYFKCVLIGLDNENDDLFSIVYKYVRNTTLLKSEDMNYSHNESTKNFTLLNSY